MNLKNTTDHYNKLSIALHWLMLLLMIAVYACIELRVFFDKGTDTREAFKMWHFMLGLSVLFIVCIRLVVRFKSGPKPLITPTPPNWQETVAKIMHLGLYVLMLAMPIAGWLILSFAGKPIPFFGLELPALVAKNSDLAKQIKEIHETAGVVGYYLIGLHAAAALFHHYVVGDNTFKRMLFEKSK
ncbi:cytochrome b [Pseudoalteromonas sp. NZS71]|uniref:cytochrome b n=2 Tax=Pseudoalteromonas TaxID=53246 RepID=UPI0004269BFE|nr:MULTISPECIES: cytochrome b [unclassified Pseudoalteromonas]MBH0063050.1 cytochrome b [Pseudoalteromonas sp. NZS71]PKH90966.1 cytochrome b [Pseudoalteromonas sp. 78C3]